MIEEPKRLHRSRSDRQLTGVLGGIAAYGNLDPSLVRIGYVILTILTGFIPGIFLYFMMTFIVPREPKGSGQNESV